MSAGRLQASRKPGISELIGGCVSLLRPGNCLLAWGGVVAGVMIGHHQGPTLLGAAAGLFAALIAGGINSLNDAHDVAADLVNRPGRPIPAGIVSKGGALVQGWILVGVGTTFALSLGLAPFLVAGGCAALGIAYNLLLRQVPLAGNVAVSAVSASPFIFGGVAAGNPAPVLTPFAFAFLFHLGRELVKDAEDRRGDAAAGQRSFAVTHGDGASFGAVAIVYGLLMIATLLPFVLWHSGSQTFRGYGIPYLVSVVAGVDLVLLYALRSLKRDRSSQNWGRISRLLKADMPVGIGVILLGAFG